jgi:hypothetical protein
LKTIEAEASTPATRDEVWSLLEDAASWADWGSWSSVEVDGGGPQGVGVERTLVKWPYRVHERITSGSPAGGTATSCLTG